MFIEQKKLPGVKYIHEKAPLGNELNMLKKQLDEQIKQNFAARNKLAVVCGPCSADNSKPIHEYLRRLRRLQETHSDLLIIARIYTAKPHSNGQGYKGTCFHESILDSVDLEKGILRARNMMIDCLRLGLPVADELLYPELYPYFADLVSYWFVGARSSEDMLHRSFASGLDLCCGLKNGTDGDIIKAVDGLTAISNPCEFPFNGSQITTDGCKYSHIVLRGGKIGLDFKPNFSSEHTRFTKERLRSLGLNDFIMADLSHANSGKVAVNQIANAELAVSNSDINGVMLESYLYGGVDSNSYGVSKTDPCLNIDETKKALDILQNGFVSRRNNTR